MKSRKGRKSYKKKRKQKESTKRRWAAWILLALAIPIIIGLIWAVVPKKNDRMYSGPTFQKEGTLQFIDENGEMLATIDIEIASDDLERERGLMWRRSMERDQGMLFIMERSEMQSFWMLNTYLSLDIIFVDSDKRIVNIASNTKPQSLDPVRSTGPAKYVVEVLGGFCAEKRIEKGDRIAIERS
jgi:uncharacterized membrane protein (UPF0127 family)